MFVPVVTSGDGSAMAGQPGESRLIKIEIAGAVVHAERGVDRKRRSRPICKGLAWGIAVC